MACAGVGGRAKWVGVGVGVGGAWASHSASTRISEQTDVRHSHAGSSPKRLSPRSEWQRGDLIELIE